jgi:hypothetical protein
MTQLRRLNLSITSISGSGLARLSGLGQLEELNCWGCDALTDAALAALKGFPRLDTLSFSGTRVTDAGLAHLKGLARLRSLDLSATGITDTGLAHLRGLQQLRALDLRETKVSKEGVAALLTAPPKLVVTTDWQTPRTPRGFLSLPSPLPLQAPPLLAIPAPAPPGKEEQHRVNTAHRASHPMVGDAHPTNCRSIDRPSGGRPTW